MLNGKEIQHSTNRPTHKLSQLELDYAQRRFQPKRQNGCSKTGAKRNEEEEETPKSLKGE